MKILYGIRNFGAIKCPNCGYEWIYDLYDDQCPNCGERV